MEKKINYIEVENAIQNIKPIGETRTIKVVGTRGAGFSIEVMRPQRNNSVLRTTWVLWGRWEE